MSGGVPPPRPREAEAERDKFVHNEQIKIRATLLNTVAAGFIVVGIVTPIVTAFRGDGAPPITALVAMIIWVLLAAALHLAALLTLERLR